MTLLIDLRYALRQLKLAPMFTVTVVLTLAFGIGACTAIFSLINAVMLKSLPVTDPSRLYQIGIGKPCCLMNSLERDWDLYSYKLLRNYLSLHIAFWDFHSHGFQSTRVSGAIKFRAAGERSHPRALLSVAALALIAGSSITGYGLSRTAGRG
jgi:hypothetical protein